MKKKKIINIGAILSVILPSATVLSCGASQAQIDYDAVSLNATNILKLDDSANAEGKIVLPSLILTQNLYDNISVKPIAIDGVSITPQIYGSDNYNGILHVKYFVTKGKALISFSKSYTGFRSYGEILSENMSKIDNLPTEVNAQGKTILPSKVTLESLYDYLQASEPNMTEGAILKATIQNSDDTKGTLDIWYRAIIGPASSGVLITFTGFMTEK